MQIKVTATESEKEFHLIGIGPGCLLHRCHRLDNPAIQVIKELRRILGCTLREAKDLWDQRQGDLPLWESQPDDILINVNGRRICLRVNGNGWRAFDPLTNEMASAQYFTFPELALGAYIMNKKRKNHG
jgi:hypothetical protein